MSFLGIDLGTGSLKVAIVDEARPRAGGRRASLMRSTRRMPVGRRRRCRHGGARSAMRWRACPKALRGDVQAIGFSGQMHGVVLIDAAGEAVRPAMLWPDTRALDLLDAWPEPQPNPVAPGMAGPLLRWIVLHEPQVARRTRWALQPKDWLRVALGGAVATDPSDACATALADPAGVWDDGAARASRVAARMVRAAGAIVCGGRRVVGEGGARARPARRASCSRPAPPIRHARRSAAGLRTTATRCSPPAPADRSSCSRRMRPRRSKGLHRYRAASDHWYRMAAMQNVGIALERVRGWLSYEWADAYREAFGDATDQRGRNATRQAHVNDHAASSLTFLPYLTGERTPWLNPSARGGWLGLALDHTRGTMMRAAFEGVAFSLRAGLDAIRASGATVTHVEARRRRFRRRALASIACRCAERRTACGRLPECRAARRGHSRRPRERSLARGRSRRARAGRDTVASPQGDAALAGRYARFLDLYGRVEPWFGDATLR